MSQSWEVLRKEARRLETDIESKLLEYSKLASSLQSSRSSALDIRPSNEDEGVQRRGTAGRDALIAEQLTADMEGLLKRLSSTVDAMRDLTQSGNVASTTTAHTLQRHGEILRDYTQEFRKTRATIGTSREHAELLSGAKATERPAGVSADMERLYAERASISAATSGADTTLATGLSLKEDLDRQRAMFASMVERMETMSEGLPAVNRLIGQIRRKRKRDVLIMAAVTSVLVFITVSWKMLG